MIFKLHHVFEVFLCVSVCACLVAAFQDHLESTINKAVNNIRCINDNDLSDLMLDQARLGRSLFSPGATAIKKLFKGAKEVRTKSSGYRKYEKKGTMETAIDDFRAIPFEKRWKSKTPNGVTRTTITSRMSSNVGQVRPQIAELAALERLEKIPIDLYWEKCCGHSSAFIIVFGSSTFLQDPTTVGSIGDLIFRLIQKDSSQYNRASINVQNKSGEFNVKIVYKKRKV